MDLLSNVTRQRRTPEIEAHSLPCQWILLVVFVSSSFLLNSYWNTTIGYEHAVVADWHDFHPPQISQNDRQYARNVHNHTHVDTTASSKNNITAPNDVAFLQNLKKWRSRRKNNKEVYDSWFFNDSDKLLDNADAQGPILDFIIAGFPKCGTTALIRNLAAVTAIPPNKDICTPIDQVVYYAYHNWAKKYARKTLKGSKCPYYTETEDLNRIGSKLPKTRLIVGVRHPVLWFQSFYNMQRYHFPSAFGLEKDDLTRFMISFGHVTKKQNTLFECKRKIKDNVCIPRARFHLPLARMGKTPLHPEEQALLMSEIVLSKKRINDTTPTPLHFFADANLSNPVLLYEATQPENEYFWHDLAAFVQIRREDLPEDQGYRVMGHGLNKLSETTIKRQETIGRLDICDPKYDFLRQQLMPIAYTLHKWLKIYFIPAARIRDDVVIPNIDEFERLIDAYQYDPCDNRLVRDESTGEYLPTSLQE